jgi:putative intracellular protease/amidase
MTSIDRRRAALLAIAAPALLAAAAASVASGAASQEGNVTQPHAPWTRPDQIAMLVYPWMTALDLIGPQYMFASLMGAQVHLVGKTRDPVTSDTGVTITPTASFRECPADLTVLFAPGGTDGTIAAMEDDETRGFIADRGARATYVTSVCTGSLILAAAGLLRGYKATSHWAAREVLSEFGAIPVDERVVRDRNRITGAGVSAGLDFGLAMVAELRDAIYAQGVQLQAEYDPHPPFTAGSPHTASPEVRAIMEPMAMRFGARARQAARALAAKM